MLGLEIGARHDSHDSSVPRLARDSCRRADHRVIVLANRAPLQARACGRRPHRRHALGQRTRHGARAAGRDLLRNMGGTRRRDRRHDCRRRSRRTERAARQSSATGFGTCVSPDDEHRGYYYGFANEGLWPLCHAVDVQPVFRPRRLRRCIGRRTRDSRPPSPTKRTANPPLVLVQDYHFALAPRLDSASSCRRARSSPSGTFRGRTRACSGPARGRASCSRVSSAATSSDSRPRDDCSNFLDCRRVVCSTPTSTASRDASRISGHTTMVRAYPVGDRVAEPAGCRTLPSPRGVPRARRAASSAAGGRAARRRRRSTGLHEGHQREVPGGRAAARDAPRASRALRVRAGCRAEPRLPARLSRGSRLRLVETAERINARFGTATYRPIRLLEAHHEPADVYRLYRGADLCYVGSLHDGMNLVAKEFVARETTSAACWCSASSRARRGSCGRRCW